MGKENRRTFLNSFFRVCIFVVSCFESAVVPWVATLLCSKAGDGAAQTAASSLVCRPIPFSRRVLQGSLSSAQVSQLGGSRDEAFDMAGALRMAAVMS